MIRLHRRSQIALTLQRGVVLIDEYVQTFCCPLTTYVFLRLDNIVPIIGSMLDLCHIYDHWRKIRLKMSAFPNTGRSDWWILAVLSGCFWGKPDTRHSVPAAAAFGQKRTVRFVETPYSSTRPLGLPAAIHHRPSSLVANTVK
jgi:hypothetical protein